MNRRLFMHLLVFDVPAGNAPDFVAAELAKELIARKIQGIVYADIMALRGVGLLTWSENPAHFVTDVRPIFATEHVKHVKHVVMRPSFGMLGRTYGIGHEPEIEHALLQRSVQNVLNPAHRWHVWYPLRRSGAFAKLEPQEQSGILREHAMIGMAYGQQELAHDIRLACHGLDAEDNEFMIVIVGKDLHSISHLVQTMRKTRQTSEFIAKMGPFFVGHVTHRSA